MHVAHNPCLPPPASNPGPRPGSRAWRRQVWREGARAVNPLLSAATMSRTMSSSVGECDVEQARRIDETNAARDRQGLPPTFVGGHYYLRGCPPHVRQAEAERSRRLFRDQNPPPASRNCWEYCKTQFEGQTKKIVNCAWHCGRLERWLGGLLGQPPWPYAHPAPNPSPMAQFVARLRDGSDRGTRPGRNPGKAALRSPF